MKDLERLLTVWVFTPQAQPSQVTTVNTLAYRWMKTLWFT